MGDTAWSIRVSTSIHSLLSSPIPFRLSVCGSISHHKGPAASRGVVLTLSAHELQHSLPADEDADTGSDSGPSFSNLDFVSLTDDDIDDDEARAVSREYKWTNRGIQALYEAGLVVVLVSPLMMDRLIGL